MDSQLLILRCQKNARRRRVKPKLQREKFLIILKRFEATGVAIFVLGIAFGVLYFIDTVQRRNLLMAGPICLAVGLLGMRFEKF